MLKNYKIGAYIYQYEEGKQPKGAIEWPPKAVEPPQADEPPKPKAKKPANKKKKVEDK